MSHCYTFVHPTDNLSNVDLFDRSEGKLGDAVDKGADKLGMCCTRAAVYGLRALGCICEAIWCPCKKI